MASIRIDFWLCAIVGVGGYMPRPPMPTANAGRVDWSKARLAVDTGGGEGRTVRANKVSWLSCSLRMGKRLSVAGTMS